MARRIRWAVAALALACVPVVGSSETPAPKAVEHATEAGCPMKGRRVIGAAELVELLPDGPSLKARVDTGATTSSMDARDIKLFERDGDRWVRFRVVDRGTGDSVKLERKVTRVVNIKRHGADTQERFVVKLRVGMGDWKRSVEFTLTNREKYDFPVLVGRNILGDGMLVDVSAEYVMGEPRPAK